MFSYIFYLLLKGDGIFHTITGSLKLEMEPVDSYTNTLEQKQQQQQPETHKIGIPPPPRQEHYLIVN